MVISPRVLRYVPQKTSDKSWITKWTLLDIHIWSLLHLLPKLWNWIIPTWIIILLQIIKGPDAADHSLLSQCKAVLLLIFTSASLETETRGSYWCSYSIYFSGKVPTDHPRHVLEPYQTFFSFLLVYGLCSGWRYEEDLRIGYYWIPFLTNVPQSSKSPSPPKTSRLSVWIVHISYITLTAGITQSVQS